MTKLWTGTEFKENATLLEIKAGLSHVTDALRGFRQQIRPDLPGAEASALLEKIDKYIGVYNLNAAALNQHETEAALAERASIIDGLSENQEGDE